MSRYRVAVRIRNGLLHVPEQWPVEFVDLRLRQRRAHAEAFQFALTRWLSVQHDRQEQAQHHLMLDTAHRRLSELAQAIDAATKRSQYDYA